MSSFELHPERLATTDEKGKRVYLFPADVRGFFRTWRSRLQFVLIFFFLALPWLRIDGRQALLLDISRREFEFFGLSLRAHNAPLLVFVFAIAGFGLFFLTALWGRVWCGWACPQTVFIDGVYRRIERWIEGPALERKRLAQAPWTLKKLAKRSLKWMAFTLTSLIITHSFLAYFVGTDRLAEMISSSPRENWGSFLFILVSTAVILFDFAWFREQFCIIACPYGRFQSILMDDHSTIVAFDSKRGEPRATPQAKALAKTHNSKLGDCVNCYRCVQVCPVGIDIRRGTQMECIACTACIDACDEVMTKTKKPTGLIRYDSARGLAGKKPNHLRARPLVYLAVVVISAGSLSYALSVMKPVDATVLRAKDAPYELVGDTTVINHFKLELSNQSNEVHALTFEADRSVVEAGLQLITPHRPLVLEKGKVTRADLFVRFPKSLLKNGGLKIALAIEDSSPTQKKKETLKKELTLVGPFN